MNSVAGLLVDLRHVVRSLARSPAFTVTAVATLAVCVGAATAVFSVVNSVLLKPLPFPQPEQLVAIRHDAPGAPGAADAADGVRMTPSMFVTYANENRSFQHVGLWLPPTTASVVEPTGTSEVRTVRVTDGVLQTLAISPLIGRPFAGADHEPGAPETALLSHGYWQRRFGEDESIVGQTVTINSGAFEIVGIMPPRFQIVDVDADLILPLQFDHQATGMALLPFCCRGIARLRPEVGISEANADVRRLLRIWMDSSAFEGNAREVFEDGWRIAPALLPLRQEVVGNVGNLLWAIMGTIAVVLLIGCANVANLSLVRAAGRQREWAVRAALGAGAWRIGRNLLAESVLLAMLGGLLGLALAHAAVQVLIAMEPSMLPRFDEITIDSRSFAFALFVSVLAGAVVGSIPALQQTKQGQGTSLQNGVRGPGLSRKTHRTQNTLVIGQVALTTALLVSAGLMIRTVQALLAVEPGFTEPAELHTLRVFIHRQVEPDPERLIRIQSEMLDAIEAIPSVTSAAFVSAMPLEGEVVDRGTVEVQGRSGDASDHAQRIFKSFSPGFLETTGMELISGRAISWADVYDLRLVAMVSENLARELWGDPLGAIGQRIRAGEGTPWREIIGVVQDVTEYALHEPAPAIVYWPSVALNLILRDDGEGHWVMRNVTVVVRSALAGTDSLQRQIEQAVSSVTPGARIESLRTMQDMYRQSLAPTLFALLMIGIGGTVALLLGVIGLYGVLMYVISRRRSEIAIRLALGGQPSDIRRSLVRYGVGLAGIGIVLGLGIALWVARLISPLLFEVEPLDVGTYLAVALVLIIVAMLASYLPAHRASAADPASVLAAE